MERCFFGAQSFGALPLAEWLRYHCPQPPRCNFLQSFFGVLRSDTQYSVVQPCGRLCPLRNPHIRAPYEPWKTSDARQDRTLVKPCLLRFTAAAQVSICKCCLRQERAADLMPTGGEISLNPPLIPPKNTIIYKHRTLTNTSIY